MQKAQADKEVKDEDIKKYISTLLDICHRGNFSMEEDLRMKFFDIYREKELPKLQKCAEQVLIEKGLCKRKSDNSDLVECIGDPVKTFGPCIWADDLPVLIKFRLLCKILQNINGWLYPHEDQLNYLLGFVAADGGANIKS